MKAAPVLLLALAAGAGLPEGRFDGLGPHRRRVATSSTEAQAWFDQGLNFLYAEDLRRWPENAWSLYGLWKSRLAQRKPAEDVENRFRSVWSKADVALTSSCLCLP